MNILITGIHGFVGSNLTHSMNGEHIICGLDIIAPEKEGIIKTYSWENLNDIPPVDIFIHLAGKAHDTKNTSNPEEYFQVNTELTKKIFDIYIKSEARDFIYFSSVKAAADVVDGMLDEMVIPNPQTPYGKSKLKAEEYLLNNDLPVGKRIFILRPCMIHGPRNKGNLNLLYEKVSQGVPYLLAAFENKRSFLSIDNLNFLIKEILQNKEIASGIYNIADDESLSTIEVVKIISKASGKNARLWKIPKKLVVAISKIGDLLHLPLNSERLKKMTENYLVSNNKIKKALNINKLPISATEGLEKTIKSFTEKQ